MSLKDRHSVVSWPGLLKKSQCQQKDGTGSSTKQLKRCHMPNDKHGLGQILGSTDQHEGQFGVCFNVMKY